MTEGVLLICAILGILIFSFVLYESRRRQLIESTAQAEQKQKLKERLLQEFIDKYKNLKPEEIILSEELGFNEELGLYEKQYLLQTVHNYSQDEAWTLINEGKKAKDKARTKLIKRQISQKADEIYGSLPKTSRRQPIPDEVKMFVWQRDNGKCVKCGSQQKLEYDHIIPLAKGGSDSERNLQLLCESCNREKSAHIVWFFRWPDPPSNPTANLSKTTAK